MGVVAIRAQGVAPEAEIRTWMRTVMAEKGWTASHWATQAGVAGTTITRVLQDADFCTSTRTIAKLSRVAGSAPG